MIKLWQKWAVMIDVNNVCGHNCIYCTKHIRHLRKDQIHQMTEDEIIRAIKSLEGWPGKIGFTGGEPLNYPDIPGLCNIVKEMIPKEKALIFTSHEKRLNQFKSIIDDTFGEVYINLHTEEQKKVCLHHPLLLAVGDMAPDHTTMKHLIENCWCNKMWSPIIGKKGAFFCDCALGFDTALDMDGGWPVEPNWWKREDYSDQIKKYCHLCGMCLPYPGQRLLDGVELISYGLYEKFKEHNLRNLENLRVIDKRLTAEEIKKYSTGWEPWHNRQDRGYEGPEYVNMKIAIISAWYNEELLAPLFLKHYDFADEIHIILDTATNDSTKEILAGDRRVIIHEMTYPPDGLDWTMKQAKIDEVYAQTKADWVFVVDADEFLFKCGERDIKKFLSRQTGEVMWARLYQVYRHEYDRDIDYNKPPVPQRRHGIPLMPESRYYHMPDRTYLKPIVIRGGKDPKWNCGCHNYFGQLTECTEMMDGAHWHMADPEIAIKRRMQTKARQGLNNLRMGYGIQNHFITVEAIIYECWLHRFDPIVIYTGFEEEGQTNRDQYSESKGLFNMLQQAESLLKQYEIEKKLEAIEKIFEEKQHENTEEIMDNIYKLFPENAIYLCKIGECLIEHKRLDMAKKVFEHGIRHQPNNAELWCNLGYIFFLEEDYRKAIEYTKKAIELEPCNSIYLENLNLIEDTFFKKKDGLTNKDWNKKSRKHTPEVSIVIPAFRGVQSTLSFIKYIRNNLCEAIADITILVRKEEYGELKNICFDSEWPIIKLYQASHGKEYIQLCNKVVEDISSDLLLFMDTAVKPNSTSIDDLLRIFISHRASAVTPKIIGRDNKILEAGFSLPEEGVLKGNGEGSSKDDPKYNYVCKAKAGSRFCMLISKNEFAESGGLDNSFDSFNIALIDLGLKILSNGKTILYQPHSEFIFEVQDEKTLIEKKRPKVLYRFSDRIRDDQCLRVLILGVYLSDQPNNIEDIVLRLSESKHCQVEQLWVSIGGNTSNKDVEKVTIKKLSEKKPKFEIINGLLHEKELTNYDYTIVVDDDIILPFNFLDEFLYLQSKYEFVLAQPARTSNSFIDHPIVEQQRGVLGRETMFIEIGPLFSVHRAIYDIIFPFDLISPMGWGYENYWSFEMKKRGFKMGIIDNTPVDHSMRKPVENYDWSEADKQRKSYWSKYPHFAYEDCFRVMEVFNIKREKS